MGTADHIGIAPPEPGDSVFQSIRDGLRRDLIAPRCHRWPVQTIIRSIPPIPVIDMADLRLFDLNLLVAFDAPGGGKGMSPERLSASASARPAMSHALAAPCVNCSVIRCSFEHRETCGRPPRALALCRADRAGFSRKSARAFSRTARFTPRPRGDDVSRRPHRTISSLAVLYPRCSRCLRSTAPQGPDCGQRGRPRPASGSMLESGGDRSCDRLFSGTQPVPRATEVLFREEFVLPVRCQGPVVRRLRSS